MTDEDKKPLNDSGKRTEFTTGAVRDTAEGKGRYDLLPMHAIFRLARVFEKGAIKYGPNNWRLGIPLHRYLDSAMRHLCEVIEGRDDEDHIAQALWNIACYIETEHWIKEGLLPKELDDVYRPQRKDEEAHA